MGSSFSVSTQCHGQRENGDYSSEWTPRLYKLGLEQRKGWRGKEEKWESLGLHLLPLQMPITAHPTPPHHHTVHELPDTQVRGTASVHTQTHSLLHAVLLARAQGWPRFQVHSVSFSSSKSVLLPLAQAWDLKLGRGIEGNSGCPLKCVGHWT